MLSGILELGFGSMVIHVRVWKWTDQKMDLSFLVKVFLLKVSVYRNCRNGRV